MPPKLQRHVHLAIALLPHVAPHVRFAAVQLLIQLSVASNDARSSNASFTAVILPQNIIDSIFQRLCGVVATDACVAVRVEALNGLAGTNKVPIQANLPPSRGCSMLLALHVQSAAVRTGAHLPTSIIALCLLAPAANNVPCTSPSIHFHHSYYAACTGLHTAAQPVRFQALSKRATLRVLHANPATTHDASGPSSAAAASGNDLSLLDSATGAFVHGVEDESTKVVWTP